MYLSNEDAAKILAALTQIQDILAKGQRLPDPIAAWVADHLVPAPGHEVRIQDAVDKIQKDLGFRVTPQRLGTYVAAPRIYHDYGHHYKGVKLT